MMNKQEKMRTATEIVQSKILPVITNLPLKDCDHDTFLMVCQMMILQMSNSMYQCCMNYPGDEGKFEWMESIKAGLHDGIDKYFGNVVPKSNITKH